MKLADIAQRPDGSFICGMGPYGCYPSIDMSGGPNNDQIWQVIAEAPYGLAYASRWAAKGMGCHTWRGSNSVGRSLACRAAEGGQILGYTGDALIDIYPKNEDPWDDGEPARVIPKWIWSGSPQATLYGMGTDANGTHYIDFCGNPQTSAGIERTTGAEVRCR